MSRTSRPDPAPRPIPAITIPPDLPIWEKREEIARAIHDHPVTIVCGETGSGKTTQIPKICLAMGRGRTKRIGHTQPRRIAARAVAERIAEELGTPLGKDVGYKVRFTDKTTPGAAIKVMTDGILLAEIQNDPRLWQYDTIILDEAHERSLNVDFLIGYLKRLLEKRRDLRLIVTSATIHPESFAAHFGGAPIVEVSGRTYPVEIRWRPIHEDDADDEGAQEHAIAEALEELIREGPGDVLVFLSSEREIRETAETLAKRFAASIEILPLFGRLAASDQHRVFHPGGKRRVVLATNIAETSLTVPGIRYVIDTGFARISRFNPRTKVQRLPIEPVSQASADQRAGRCGRLGPGICIRLYSEEDYQERERFTPPEILRTNLASVILQMKVMGLGDLETFPFLDPPDARAAREGVRLLQDLRALDDAAEPTEIGRQLARFPVDPRIGRIVLAGRDEGCLPEALVTAAALSVVDPRERPADNPAAADEAQARFADPRSDFLAYLALWDELQEKLDQPTRGPLRRWSRESFLSYTRLREWTEVHRQLVEICREIPALRRGAEAPRRPVAVASRAPMKPSRDDRIDGPGYAPLHRALLTGLLANVGLRDEERSTIRAPPASSSSSSPGRRCSRSRPSGSWRRSWSRRPGSTAAPARASIHAGSRTWARTWSSAPTPIRGGTRPVGACWRRNESRSPGCRSRRGGRSTSDRSIRWRRATCSCAAVWSKARSAPAVASSSTTGRWWNRSPRSRTGRGAATSSPARRRSSRSTRSGCPRAFTTPPRSRRGVVRPRLHSPPCSTRRAATWCVKAL